MKQGIEKVMEEFRKNRPRDDESLDNTGESETYLFGYKYSDGKFTHEVTDWGHIKSFLRSAIETAFREVRPESMKEEIEKYYQNQAKEFIDGMYDAKVFHEKLTRDDFNGFEDLLAFVLQSQARTAMKMAEFSVKYKGK